MELPPPTAPLHRYVSRFDEQRGCTVFSDGLAEYEARDDGCVVVTLVRAVGELSRSDLPERPGHAGWPSQRPARNASVRSRRSFALMLHGARDAGDDRRDRARGRRRSRSRSSARRSARRSAFPIRVVGVELMGVGLAFSAIKESEDGVARASLRESARRHRSRGSWRLAVRRASKRIVRDSTKRSIEGLDIDRPSRRVRGRAARDRHDSRRLR